MHGHFDLRNKVSPNKGPWFAVSSSQPAPTHSRRVSPFQSAYSCESLHSLQAALFETYTHTHTHITQSIVLSQMSINETDLLHVRVAVDLTAVGKLVVLIVKLFNIYR
jgi:hypothetical protein